MISSIESRNRAERISGFPDELDERFHQPQGSVLLIRGHVLQVKRNDNDSMGMQIPTYTAVIDYIVEREKNENIQIRKHFETQQALEQGFANVELLVIPEEPTHSILKEDFEMQLEQEKLVQQLHQEREKRKQTSSFDDSAMDEDDGPLGDLLDGGYCNKKCKRMTVVFAAILTLVSLMGTFYVVCLMPQQNRWTGWLSFGFGLIILVPVSLLIRKCLKKARRWNESSEKQGFIVQSSTKDGEVISLSASQQSMKETLVEPSLSDACMPASCEDLVDGLCDNHSKFSYTDAASYIVPELGGCYFVRYPTYKNAPSQTFSPKRECLTCPLPESEEVKERTSSSTVSSLSNEDHVDDNFVRSAWVVDPNDSPYDTN